MESILWNTLQQAQFNTTSLMSAFVCVCIGLLVSLWIRSITIAFADALRIDDLLKRIGLMHFFSTVEVTFSSAKIIGVVTQTFIIFVSLLLASEIIQLRVFSQLLEKVVVYYPRIFIAILICIFGARLIDISQKMVVGTVTLRHISFSRILGKALDWSIRILIGLAVLYQLTIIPELIFIVFTGFILALSLAAGISLGLAGKKPMEKMLDELSNVFNPKQ